MGTPERVMLVLAVALVGATLAFGTSASSPQAPAAGAARRVPVIARRVELLRGLDFRSVPKPRQVSAAQARKEGVAELDASYPPKARHADEETLKLLGLLPARADLRKISGSIYGEQVAGYYDPRRKRLSVVQGASGFQADVVLAHELTHALEDQTYGIKEPAPGTDDGATADTALVEGTATALMLDYTRRYESAASSLGDALGSLGGAASTTKLPRYVQDSLEFPYLGGLSFVTALRRRAGGAWKEVNAALRHRRPSTTEQIMHPEKWVRGERALPVTIGARRVLAPAGYRRLARGELGEWDTREILLNALDPQTAAAAARGWGGGRYELWQDARRRRGCPAPCRPADALVLAWRWDTAADARAFAAALTAWLPLHLRARPLGHGRWTVGRGAAFVDQRPRATTLVFAPSAGRAARLAGAVAR